MPSLSTFGGMSARGFGFRTASTFEFTITTSQQELNLSTYLTTQGWNGWSRVSVTIDSGVYIWSDDTSVGGLTIPSSMNDLVTITNNGYIIGRGGNGGGYDGGPALVNNATGVTLINASNAFIAGGGGGGGGSGGGGGAGGGTGGTFVAAGGAGGAIGQSGSDGGKSYAGALASKGGEGGGAGGGGGNFEDSGSSFLSYGAGGGGGRILTGVGGSAQCSIGSYGYGGGAGGSANNAGTTGCNNGFGGGGGWGAAGGSGRSVAGGSGGAAISGTTIATYTNNGTVYGSVA
jgi:hypothetical protein